jgi:hypothetical protein
MTWTRAVKRLLKRPLLVLLRLLSEEVETNWQRGKGPR